MELRECKTRAPLLLFVTITLFLFQLWTVTAEINQGESSKEASVKSQSTKTSRFLSSSATAVSLTGRHFSFGFRWARRRHHRHRINRAKIEFLFAHNLIRARVGEPPLKWDGRLAAYARAWASQRVKDCRLVHSNGPFGENIFWAGQNNWRPRDVVKVWADEDKFYDASSNTCQSGEMCGHYTQIVWRDTTKLGCARVDCANGGVYAICVYDPPGNYDGENPFESYTEPFGHSREEAPATIFHPFHGMT